MTRALLLAAAEQERLRNLERIERRMIRETSRPMQQLSESSFIDNFRLTKDQFQTLCHDLAPFLPTAQRSTAVLPETKILAALQFYAFGGYQHSVGTNYKLGLAQQTVSDCLAEVTDALNHPDILRKYIVFPTTDEERLGASMEFNEKFGFPGAIGCIDGTHVAIIRPHDNEEAYFNRKMYHSLNVMVVCDANLHFTYCDASFGGASHDSHIWNSSPVKSEMEEHHARGSEFFLLGDSGYAQRDWMMTPILNTAPNTPEDYYTHKHVRTRNVIERLFGILKSRFRCLLAHRVLHYDPVKAGKIFNACAVLHNLINNQNFPIDLAEIARDHERQPPRVPQRDNNFAGRDAVVQRLWTYCYASSRSSVREQGLVAAYRPAPRKAKQGFSQLASRRSSQRH